MPNTKWLVRYDETEVLKIYDQIDNYRRKESRKETYQS